MLQRMGTIYYGGSATPIDIEDRALAHLKVVIASKLRRGESFTVSWRHPDDQPRGRSTIWLHPSIPLRFVFEKPDQEVLSREWLEELANSANSSGGIMLIAEHFDTGSILTTADREPARAGGAPDEDGQGAAGSAEKAIAGSKSGDDPVPPIETWWPRLSTQTKHVVLRDPCRPLTERVRREIEKITGTPVAEGAALSDQDVAFVETQQEPVD